MRILHVGFGFRPLRYGGLIAYAEDLMQAQLARGHEPSWFCAGRHLPWGARPRLHRWTRRGVRVYEVLNCPVRVGGENGTLAPLRELDELATEALFERALRDARPDVVHVQELLGLPSSLLEVARRERVPVVMTLHDYFTLCPTLKLYDADRRVNLRTEVGEQCARCSRDAPAGDRGMRAATAWMYYARLLEAQPWVGGLAPRAKRALAPVLARRRAAAPRTAPSAPPAPPGAAPTPPAEYQRRRDANVERLSRVDRLVAVSGRVEQIHRLLGVSGERMRAMPITVSHLDALRPRPEPEVGTGPLQVATINGCASREKGAEVVLGAFEQLHARGLGDRLSLTVLGYVAPEFAARLDRLPGARRTGSYLPRELDALLDGVDVGLVPSTWEEAYGFVGLEFLAKGIPVVGNAIGGITDYTRDGETGWLNRDCSAGGLAAILEGILERPQQVPELHRAIVAARPRLIRSMDVHAGEVLGLYEDVLGG